MAKVNHWDIARYANTMAVQATIAIDPTQITARIKNKLIKWLEQAHLDGGHRSEARKLGELLAKRFQLPTTMTTWQGVRAHVTSRQMAKELRELLRADWAAALLEHPHMNGSTNWYRRQYEAAMRCIAEVDPKVAVDIQVHSKEYRRSILECLGKYVTAEERSRIQQAINALNGTEPIVCINNL